MKNDLSLPETDTLASDTLARLRKNLGSDYIVLGSYLDLGDGSDIRVDFRVQDAATGQIVSIVTRRGSQSRLDELITQAGADLRSKLGAGPAPAAEEVVVRAELPSNVEAARLYSQGLEKLRSFDSLAARDLLEKAVVADPKHAMSYANLAAAWNSLGYDLKAAEAAKKAFDLSGGLRQEERLRVEGQYYEVSHQWDKAIETYRTLYQASPDNLDYGLNLAQAQISGGKIGDAVATLGALRKLPAPQGNDLRIDLGEAVAAGAASDYKRQETLAVQVAEKAKQQGARLLVSKARQYQCAALRNLGDPKGAISVCQEGRAISAEAGDRSGEAAILNSMANALYDQGDLPGAKKMYDQAAAIYRSIGNKSGLAGSTDNAANVVSDQGDFASARKLTESALSMYREVGDQSGVGETLNNLATEMLQQGDLAGAQKNFQASLDIWRQIGSPSNVAIALNNLGDMRMALADLAGAKSAYQESFETFSKNGERSKSAYPLVGLGDVYAASGEFAKAKKSYEESLAISREAGEKHETAVALASLGAAFMQQGDLPGARDKIREAINLRNEIGEKSGSAEVALLLANLSIEEGHPSAGEATARDALATFRAAKMPELELQAHAILAEALLEQGKAGPARQEIAQGNALAARTQQRRLQLQFEIAAARVLGASGRPSDVQAARSSLDSVIRETEKLRILSDLFDARFALGEMELKYGNRADGQARLSGVEKDATSSGFLLVAKKAAQAADLARNLVTAPKGVLP